MGMNHPNRAADAPHKAGVQRMPIDSDNRPVCNHFKSKARKEDPACASFSKSGLRLMGRGERERTAYPQ